MQSTSTPQYMWYLKNMHKNKNLEIAIKKTKKPQVRVNMWLGRLTDLVLENKWPKIKKKKKMMIHTHLRNPRPFNKVFIKRISLIQMEIQLPVFDISTQRCLWSCFSLGSACLRGQSLSLEPRTRPSWVSWPCSPERWRSWHRCSHCTSEWAHGSARSRSTSATHHPL